jgi:hypothetical protein
MTETLKLLKRFAAVCLILLCIIAMASGAAIVSTNSRQLAFGEAGQQVGFSFDAQIVTIQTQQQLFEWTPVVRWVRLAPAPVGTWLMLAYAAFVPAS